MPVAPLPTPDIPLAVPRPWMLLSLDWLLSYGRPPELRLLEPGLEVMLPCPPFAGLKLDAVALPI
jgi:hypothetical protein